MHQRIKELRKKLGVSQRQLGIIVNTSQECICRWESGKIPIEKKYVKLLCICEEAVSVPMNSAEKLHLKRIIEEDGFFGSVCYIWTRVEDIRIDAYKL